MLTNVLCEQEVISHTLEFATSRGVTALPPYGRSVSDEPVRFIPNRAPAAEITDGCDEEISLSSGCLRGTLIAFLIEGTMVLGGFIAWEAMRLFH